MAETRAGQIEAGYTPVHNKTLLSICVMLAVIMQVLDTSIANVAIPHIQASLSATQDEAAWVLTSYIIAAAVMYPLTGWLANSFGRRQIFLISVVIFVVASALCGMATSLTGLVLARLLQGIGGAALVPLSQALLFEINRPQDFGRAMSVWGVGVTLAPILGPTLGGWLTDNYSWRWVFYINLPLGLVTFAGLYLTLPRKQNLRPTRFDFFGFATLSLAVASLQLLLDRGQTLGWFESREIITEAVLAGLGFYLFLVHIFSSSKPYVSPAMFADRNFLLAAIFVFLNGMSLYTTLALHPLLLQSGLHYPVVLVGIVLAPRGLGSMIGMFAAARLLSRMDSRIIMGVGMVLATYSLWLMTQYSLEMDSWPVIWAGILQGIGIGAVNVCISTVAFLTLPAIYRNEATGVASLIRSIGGAIGISVMIFLLTQNTQRLHSSLGEHITPYNMTANPAASAAHVDILSTNGLMALNALVTSQSAMIAYIDDFKLLMVFTLLTLPFVLLFKRPRSRTGA